MAFRLNDRNLIRRVYENIPISDIRLVVQSTPRVYLGRLLRFVTVQAEESPHLEFNLLWVEAILSYHGRWMKDNKINLEAEVRAAERVVRRIKEELGKLVDGNLYRIEYLLSQPQESLQQTKRLNFGSATEDYSREEAEDSQEQSGSESEDEWMGLD